jgi:hypothetical protein
VKIRLAGFDYALNLAGWQAASFVDGIWKSESARFLILLQWVYFVCDEYHESLVLLNSPLYNEFRSNT